MECNKDEALRAKEIAENKFLKKDLTGAKKFALKAQTLFPPLDGISQFITAVDVHLMAEHRVADEKDWYAIMSLSPSADEMTVRKQYKQLVLHLHPDKNHSPGAECAFKLVQEAFRVLTDKSKRSIFDQKRKKTQAGVRSSRSNWFSSQEKSATQAAARFVPRQTATRPPPVPRPPNPNTASCSGAQGVTQNAAQQAPQTSEESSTFWTRCSSCSMWFEYSLIYQNLFLICRGCTLPFRAADAGRPVLSYKFEEMQAWKDANNSGPKKWWDGNSSSNPGSSANASVGSCGKNQNRPSNKRMREEGNSAVNGSSC